jgi:hypothetical protein
VGYNTHARYYYRTLLLICSNDMAIADAHLLKALLPSRHAKAFSAGPFVISDLPFAVQYHNKEASIPTEEAYKNQARGRSLNKITSSRMLPHMYSKHLAMPLSPNLGEQSIVASLLPALSTLCLHLRHRRRMTLISDMVEQFRLGREGCLTNRTLELGSQVFRSSICS